MTRTLILNCCDRALDSDAVADQHGEIVGLAGAISLDVIRAVDIRMSRITPATYLTSGKVDEIRALVHDDEAEIIVVNAALSPVQQRNLEREWKAKVLDRKGLILEIFGARAQTREGVMQVELAHLTYQRSRLVRSWTHLERQRGGAGFMGGPGETQIEADRRIIDEKILRLKRQLEKVVKTRELHRASRKKAPYPVAALVGYTNAGKSTLFNRITEADVMAKDMLFATLDPTMRKVNLPSERMVILSDTVGFISDLPTELIAAFRATLEEVIEADLILHVRDISSPNSAAQAANVEEVLESLGIESDRPVIEVHNKIDRLSSEERASEIRASGRNRQVVPLSARTGMGCDQLLHDIEAQLFPETSRVRFRLPHSAGAAISWIHDRALSVTRVDQAEAVELTAEMAARDLAQFEKTFGPGYTLSGVPVEHTE